MALVNVFAIYDASARGKHYSTRLPVVDTSQKYVLKLNIIID
jgi:hypothetical protein